MQAKDAHTNAAMEKTAASFMKLAGLRGVSSHVEVRDFRYVANGVDCGCSVHGLYDWLNKQPGVKP